MWESRWWDYQGNEKVRISKALFRSRRHDGNNCGGLRAGVVEATWICQGNGEVSWPS